MSRMPYLSNELFPWPHIHLGGVSPNATVIDQRTTYPRLCRGSTQSSGNISSSTKPRGRASSDAGPASAKSQVRGRNTSFGSTQEYEDVYSSRPVQRLDRKLSDRKLQELLKLRKQKLQEAERKGDNVEVLRLKNLTLFDDFEKCKTEHDEPQDLELSGNLTRQIDHRGSISQIGVLDFNFTPQPKRPKSVNQGHTATLCWHLKLQYTQGMAVPKEFSQCDIHPIPTPGAFSSSSSTLQPASPSSLSTGSTPSLRHTKVSPTGFSTLKDSSEPSSPSTWPPTAIALELSSPMKDSWIVPIEHSSIAPSPNEEDPFLYIAKYIKSHVKSDKQFKEAKQSGPQASSAEAKRSIHIQCTCKTHNCHTYLSGSPSKHCRFCKLPKLQPEIHAAVERIKEMKTSVLVQTDKSPPAEGPSEADGFRKLEALQEDMRLVEMYCTETEKRCRSGVWWEGWLIVQDLKRQGVVGSKAFVNERDESDPNEVADEFLMLDVFLASSKHISVTRRYSADSNGLADLKERVRREGLEEELMGYDEALMQKFYLPVGLGCSGLVGVVGMEWRSFDKKKT